MPFSGLVITLCDDESGRETALAALSREPDVEVGPRDGRRLAAVLEVDDDARGRRRFDAIRSLSGVEHVDVVFIEFGETTTDRPASDPVPETVPGLHPGSLPIRETAQGEP